MSAEKAYEQGVKAGQKGGLKGEISNAWSGLGDTKKESEARQRGYEQGSHDRLKAEHDSKE